MGKTAILGPASLLDPMASSFKTARFTSATAKITGYERWSWDKKERIR